MYVHCVMDKCIMVKLGERKTHKVCKKDVNFTKAEGNVVKQQKWGRNFKLMVNDLKKGKIGKILHGTRKNSEIVGENLKQGECIIASEGMNAPVHDQKYALHKTS